MNEEYDLELELDESELTEEEVSVEDLPDPGLYVITITVDHEKFDPVIDFGGAPMFLVKSLLADITETLSLLSPPVTVATNGSIIFSPYYDEEDEDE